MMNTDIRTAFISYVALSLFAASSVALASVRKYSVDSNVNLRYVVAAPSESPGKQFETWILQPGDGSVRDTFAQTPISLQAKLISTAYNVVVVYPELRRQYWVQDPETYCNLNFSHRVLDLSLLIDDVLNLSYVDPKRIVLVGESAGSEVVTVVANSRTDVAAVVTIGGGPIQLYDYAVRSGEAPELVTLTNNKCADGSYWNRSGEFWKQLLYSGLNQEIRKVKVPYLALLGEHDSIIRPSLVKADFDELKANVPGFDYRIIPGMGHTFGPNVLRWKVVKNWTSSK